MTSTTSTSSATKWIGEVPSGWRVLEPRRVFSLRREPERPGDIHLTPSQKYGVLPQEEYVAITGSQVVRNLSGTTMQHVEAGDFISHLRTFQGGLELAKQAGKVSPAYTVVTPGPEAFPNYYKYVLKSRGYISQIASVTDQLRDGQSMRFPEFNETWLPVPPFEEQKLIADYLDRETAEIDAFISDSEQMARLVDERRKAERSVLLRRLNKRVPLKRKARLVTGGTPQEISTTTDSDGVFWIKPGDIGAGRDGTKGNIKLTPHSASQLPAVESEAVVVVGIGSVGKVGFMVPPFVTNQQITTVIPLGSTDPAFLYHVLADSEQWIRNSANGTTLPIINNSILGLVPTPDIPQPEQAEIVEFLDAKERQASEAIAELESAIQLAKERRSALISVAVTGQIDVAAQGVSAAEQLRDELEVHL